MGLSKYMRSVLKGTVGTLLFTLVGIAILSFVMTKLVFSKTMFNMLYAIICMVSLTLGAVIAAKKNETKGWLVGIGVGIGYYLIVMLFSLILGGKLSMSALGALKFFITLIIAALGGAFGVNMAD